MAQEQMGAPCSVYDVAAAWRGRRGSIGDVRLHKLLYYTQAWHFTWHGRPLFDEAIEAWAMGPVVADLWRSQKWLDSVPAGDESRVPSSGWAAIRFVDAEYGALPGYELSRMTHSEHPWLLARELAGVSAGERSDAPIPLEAMKEAYGATDAADQAWFWSDEWQALQSDGVEPHGEVLDEDAFLESLA